MSRKTDTAILRADWQLLYYYYYYCCAVSSEAVLVYIYNAGRGGGGGGIVHDIMARGNIKPTATAITGLLIYPRLCVYGVVSVQQVYVVARIKYFVFQLSPASYIIIYILYHAYSECVCYKYTRRYNNNNEKKKKKPIKENVHQTTCRLFEIKNSSWNHPITTTPIRTDDCATVMRPDFRIHTACKRCILYMLHPWPIYRVFGVYTTFNSNCTNSIFRYLPGNRMFLCSVYKYDIILYNDPFFFYGFITMPWIIALSCILYKKVFVRQINAASVDPEPGDWIWTSTAVEIMVRKRYYFNRTSSHNNIRTNGVWGLVL